MNIFVKNSYGNIRAVYIFIYLCAWKDARVIEWTGLEIRRTA